MADGPIDTTLFGDENSARATAQQLLGLAEGTHGLGNAFTTTRGSSEFWQGASGDAFRNIVARSGGNATEVGEHLADCGQSLNCWADEIITVKTRITQARNVARLAGLRVTDTQVEPPVSPGPAPQRVTGPMSPDQEAKFASAVNAHGVAASNYAQQVAAYNEVVATVSQARGIEKAAHEALQQKFQHGTDTVTQLRTWVEKPLKATVGLAAGLSGMQAKLMDSVDRSRNLVDLSKRILSDPNLTPTMRDKAEKALGVFYRTSSHGAQQLDDIDRTIGALPQSVRNALQLKVADKLVDWGVPGITKDTAILQKLPVIGTALVVGSTGVDIGTGKDPAKSVEKSAGSIAAGWGSTAIIEAGFDVAAATGWEPGPGWVVAGVAIGGSVAAAGVGWVVDKYGDEFNREVGSLFK